MQYNSVRQWSYPVGVNTRPGRARLSGHVETSRHQILLGIHQVIKVLFVQQALEELAVIGTGKLHAVVSLSYPHVTLLIAEHQINSSSIQIAARDASDNTFVSARYVNVCREKKQRKVIIKGHTWITRYRCGSRAILQNSAASSLNFGLLSASIIQPGEEKEGKGRMPWS